MATTPSVDTALRPAPEAASRLEQRRRRLVLLGVLGAVVMFTGLVLVWVLAVPLFTPGDEAAHVDYAVAVTHGHLPVAGHPYTAEFPQLHQPSGYQHVSNHPPLYYLLVGPIVRLAVSSHHPQLLLILARLFGVVFSIGDVVLLAYLTWLVGARLTPRTRSLLTVAGGGLAAGLPSFVAASGAIQNDSLELLLVAAALCLIAAAARYGLTRRRLVGLAVVCAAGMLSRITFVPVLVVAAAAALLLGVWPRLRWRRPDLPAWLRGIGGAALVGVTTLAATGWFYALNHRRYGDFTGGSAVYFLVRYRTLSPIEQHGALHYAVQPQAVYLQLLQVVGDSSGGTTARLFVWILFGTLVLGLVGLAVSGLRGRRWPDLVGWLLAITTLLVALAAYAEMADHVTQKGAANNRYLLDGLCFWVVVGAAAVVCLRWRGGFPWLAPLAVAIPAGGSVVYALSLVRRDHRLAHLTWLRALHASMAGRGLPFAWGLVALMFALMVIGFALQVAALGVLSRVTEPAASPAGPVAT